MIQTFLDVLEEGQFEILLGEYLTFGHAFQNRGLSGVFFVQEVGVAGGVPPHSDVGFVFNVGRGGMVEVVPVELVEVDESSFIIGVLSFWFVHESQFVNMFVDLVVGEVSVEVGVCEWVVVGQGYLIDMVGMDKLFRGRYFFLADPTTHHQ